MKIQSTNSFFTSDLHFFHGNIIDFCERPFSSSQEMYEVLISNFNEVVPEDGETFILGDFGMVSSVEKIQTILSKMNGKKHLILGNHDYQNKINRPVVRELFFSVNDILDLRVLDDEMDDKEQRLFLCHYPMNSWAGSGNGSWNLFGHIHSKPYNYDPQFNPRTLDVGVDAHNYYPISYQRVKELITKQCLVRQRRDGMTEEEINNLIK